MDTLQNKKEKLESIITGMGSVAVAFSGGVDSTFLLKTAHGLLGDRAVAVTALPLSFPAREAEAAERFCRNEGIKQITVTTDEMSIEGFAQNPPDRCYLCKRHIFTRIIDAAEKAGMSCVADGTNAGDAGTYRPGLAALRELGVRSPLLEAGLDKPEIRNLSEMTGIRGWDRQSISCLYTRFAYGDTLTKEKLKMVEQAEQRLLDLGFRRVRVRVHGNIARIETDLSELGRLTDPEISGPLYRFMRELGFMYVTADLGGYESGSMDRELGTFTAGNRDLEQNSGRNH